ncbi:MAG: hypothetical protein GY787_32780 [Alteromonadales bacterium]|nr:hypothetical protein [Alteromonadales bacterium]
MFKRPTLIILSLVAATLLFSASAFVWQTYDASNQQNLDDDTQVSKADLSWQEGSKTVDLDNYIANNQVSQNIKDKKQRVMLEPELITFHGVLQAPVNSTKADLVTDSLAVWGISPLPEVAFSTYIRSPQGQVIAVYVENTIANHISSYYQPETVLALQAYRLYNYAKGPRLLLVGVKPVEQELALAIKAGAISKADADINGTDTKDGESTESSAKASQVVEQETTSL